MARPRGSANIADKLFGWHPRGWGGGFLAHPHSPRGYDEPEILRYSNRQFGPIGADAGQVTPEFRKKFKKAAKEAGKKKVDFLQILLTSWQDQDPAQAKAKA
jgi:hypothetical protein